MRPAEVKRLMDAMADAGVSELELEQRDADGLLSRVRLVRGVAHSPLAAASVPAPAVAAPQAAPAAAVAPEGAIPSDPAPAPAAPSRLVDVVAPIVGTFYASPAPDAAAYVKPGDRVQVGSVLCIIEAMKLMNEIEAEVAGTIVEVLVTNEDPVEYGQVLFRIDPS